MKWECKIKKWVSGDYEIIKKGAHNYSIYYKGNLSDGMHCLKDAKLYCERGLGKGSV